MGSTNLGASSIGVDKSASEKGQRIRGGQQTITDRRAFAAIRMVLGSTAS